MNNIKVQIQNSTTSDITIINNGVFSNLATTLDSFPNETNFIIITDQNIINKYDKEIHSTFKKHKYDIITLPPGEQTKNISNIDKIYSKLLELGANKGSCLIAIGGGVIGDITGFVASTFMRGIKYVNIPTSLLAMVDSSIGGKTGINLSKGKNLVGSIYHPSKIIIDPVFLNTLPHREYYSGMVEIIKYGLILDKSLFDSLKLNFKFLSPDNLDIELLSKIIRKCVELKSTIVQEDEKDNGIRNILNFGHTIGHALESYFDYDYIRHGEAVAYGILYSSKLSNKYSDLSDEDLQEINEIINKISLPSIQNLDVEKLINYIMSDKKNINKSLNFILLDSIGKAKITNKISTNEIIQVLEDYEHTSY